MKKEISFGRLIGTSIATKVLVDTGNQIFNPFLPMIAAGLGIDVIMLGRLVGLRSAMGIFSPLFGALADRRGYRMVIRTALLMNAAGFLLLGGSRSPWMTVLAMILAGLGAASFVPTLQAYVSGRLPYAIRARGLGMIEYSWALTGIVALPLIGLLIEATNWRVPFFLLAAGMVVMSFVFARMPAAQHELEKVGALTAQPRASFRAFFRLGNNARSAYATILAGALSYFAAMQVMIVHGAWLAAQYGLTASQLGLVAFVLGFFDLAASVSVSLFTDRIGKRRSVLIGIVGSLVGYMAMPYLNTGVVPAVLAIGATRMLFEFNIVSHFPLLSEQAPAQRAKAMTLGSSIALIAATVAGFTGPWLLVNVGVAGVAWTSAVAVTMALIAVLLLVHEPGH